MPWETPRFQTRVAKRASRRVARRARERLQGTRDPARGDGREETRRRRLLEERTGHAVALGGFHLLIKTAGRRSVIVRAVQFIFSRVSSYLTTGQFASSGEESPETRRFCKSLYLSRRQAYLTLTLNQICLPHLRKIISILFYTG